MAGYWRQPEATDAVIVDEPWRPGEGPKADAVVTARPGIAVGVGTADCGPVLFADAEGAQLHAFLLIDCGNHPSTRATSSRMYSASPLRASPAMASRSVVPAGGASKREA